MALKYTRIMVEQVVRILPSAQGLAYRKTLYSLGTPYPGGSRIPENTPVQNVSMRLPSLRVNTPVRSSSRQFSHVGAVDTVTIAPDEFDGLSSIAESALLLDNFRIYLPAGVNLIATLMTRAAIMQGDSSRLILINNTVKTARLCRTSASDSISPADDILIPAGSTVTISAYVIGTYAVQYMLIGAPATTTGTLAGYANLAAFPPIGDSTRIYTALDTGAIYRYGPSVIPNFDWTVGTDGDFPDLATALASPLVLDGHGIYVFNGTYDTSAGLLIDKEVRIFGESRAGVILDSTALGTETMITVSADNVALVGMTITHAVAAVSADNTAILISGALAVRSDSVIIDNCLIQHQENGVRVRCDNWRIANCGIEYIGAGVAIRRGIVAFAVRGNAFIQTNIFTNAAVAGDLYAITLDATVNPEDIYSGTLYIEESTHVGTLARLVDQTAFPGVAGLFNLSLKRNITTETSAFVQMTSAIANFGDLFGSLTAQANQLANSHDGGDGKGIFGVDGGIVAFRSVGDLPIHILANILTNAAVNAGYTVAVGASVNSCCYISTMPPVAVVQDALIPATPAPPVTPTVMQTVQAYSELSPAPSWYASTYVLAIGDLVFIDLDREALPHTIIAHKNRVAIFEGADYTVSVVGGKTRLTWAGALITPLDPLVVTIADIVNVTYSSIATF